MRALVVYESMFGNTRDVALAVVDGLASGGRVDAIEVGDAPSTIDDDVDLVVVGGPTHAHGMSRDGTRDGAAQQSERPVISGRRGIREWIASLDAVRPDVHIATFDTRFAKPRWITGSAAVSAAKLLRRRGGREVAPPESFFVDATAGPLAAGEVDRARQWGKELAQAEGGAS